MPRKLAAGNWKMNGLAADLGEFAAIATAADADIDVVICPPATLLSRAVDAAQATGLVIGAQDCHAATSGAHTGDIAAAMLVECGARYVIVGHSERRAAHFESDADVRAKAEAVIAAGLTAIICIGESEEEREVGQTLDILGSQLAISCPDSATAATCVLAYEPIWAIGTGRTPTQTQIIEVHDFLREALFQRFGADGEAIRLLYGGSVKAGNAATIFEAENVDGALVGGASLKAADFTPIIAALLKT